LGLSDMGALTQKNAISARKISTMYIHYISLSNISELMTSGFTRQPVPQLAGQQAGPAPQGATEIGSVGEVEIVGHLVAGVATALVQLHGHARAGLVQLLLKAGAVLVQLALEGRRAHMEVLSHRLQSQRLA